MPPRSANVPEVTFKILEDALKALGLPVDTILDKAQALPHQLNEDDTRTAVWVRIWEAAVQHTGDETVPLKMSATTPFGTYDVVDYVAAASATLGESLKHLARYFRLVSPFTMWEVDETVSPRRLWLGNTHEDAKSRRYFMQHTLGVTVSRYHNSLSRPLTFARVALALPKPRDEEAYSKLFGCEVEYGHERTLLAFSEEVWTAPMVGRSASLQRAMQQQLDKDLEQLNGDAQPLIAARIAVREALPHGAPRLVDIASQVAMSERTLQRRLSAEGTTFQALVDEERRQAALHHIRSQRLSVGDVAYLLGYSEASAFVRAFKRWTDQTPNSYRRSLQSGS